MNNSSKIYWENLYSANNLRTPSYDGWLDKYMFELQNADTIIDLGSGNGVNTFFLHKNRIEPIACDFSEVALAQIRNKNAAIQTICFDMSMGLPFENESINIVIADLSLHYFEWYTTEKIIKELFRVLKKNGVLLCRVNSTKEYIENENDKLIEYRYYFNGSNCKRYFSENDIYKLFSNYNLKHIQEGITEKYGYTKYLWEIAVENKEII